MGSATNQPFTVVVDWGPEADFETSVEWVYATSAGDAVDIALDVDDGRDNEDARVCAVFAGHLTDLATP